MPLALTITPKGFEEAMKAMQAAGKNAQKAARDAIQRGLTTGRKIADQEIRQRYAIKSAAVKAEMTVKVAGLNGSVEAKGPNLPVSLFAPMVDRKRKMVTVEIIKDAGNQSEEQCSWLRARSWREDRQRESQSSRSAPLEFPSC